MKERPILLNAPMVRATLEGRKTQTRRIVKPQPDIPDWQNWYHMTPKNGKERFRKVAVDWPDDDSDDIYCPYGQEGDRLWVRETWKYFDWTEDGYPFVMYSADDTRRLCEQIGDDWGERLLDIWAELSIKENYSIDKRASDRRWRPSIHMPRWASRILLEITGVRVERLNGINEADAIAEGIEQHKTGLWLPCAEKGKAHIDPRLAYRDLWESINGPGSWAANPWVWVIEFKVQL